MSKRITDPSIPELTSVADDDLLYVMDVSDTTGGASGTSKKVKKSNLGGSQWVTTGSDIYYNTGDVAIGATSAHASAKLDLISTTQGLGLPNMTQAQRDAISSPREGLAVYDTDFAGLWVRGQFSTWNNYRVTFNLANFFDAAWLDLNEATGNGGSKIRITAPAALSADYTVTLPAITGTVVVGPGTTTVGSLGSASPAGRRGFVSDANATTFNSVVAGGGANFVPIFSDGTNWRIG